MSNTSNPEKYLKRKGLIKNIVTFSKKDILQANEVNWDERKLIKKGFFEIDSYFGLFGNNPSKALEGDKK